MTYAKDDKSVESISELISELNSAIDKPENPIWFRGQADKQWELLPKLFRKKEWEAREQYFISRFKQNASYVLGNSPGSEFEWLFLMQHYGAPTRLLDWSESPLIALYFAVAEMEHHEQDGVLWVLLPCELNLKSHYSNDGFPQSIPSFEDDILQNYLPSAIFSERSSKMLPMAAIAARNSHRMLAQQGAFTIHHRKKECLSNVSNKILWRYIIPKNKKNFLLKELKLLGIARFQLFPELENITEL